MGFTVNSVVITLYKNQVSVDKFIKKLNRNGIKIEEENRMNNNLGVVLKTVEGCLINIYDTGKVNCQGKNKEKVEDDIQQAFQGCEYGRNLHIAGTLQHIHA